MKKTIIATVLSVSILLSACSSKQETETSASSEKVTTTTTAEATTEVTTEATTTTTTEATTAETEPAPVEISHEELTAILEANIEIPADAFPSDWYHGEGDVVARSHLYCGDYGYAVIEYNPESEVFKSLKVGDPIPEIPSFLADGVVNAIYNQYVLYVWECTDMDNFVYNKKAPYSNPNAQAIYDAFVAIGK